MAEEKHRMLYQGQDPSQARAEPYQFTVQVPVELEIEMERQRPLSLSPSEPPTYDDAMALTPALAHFGYTADRRRTFFAEPQHLRYRLEEMPYLVAEVPQLQVVPEVPELPEEEEESPSERGRESHVQGRRPSPPVRRESRLGVPLHFYIFYIFTDFFALTPQPKLGSRAVDIMCPACGQQGVTRLRRSPHSRTHVAALWLCTFG